MQDLFSAIEAPQARSGMSLSSEQEAAAHAPGRSTLVIAGAGAGKTTTIAARVRWLVEGQGVDPASVVVATYTNKAAKEIRARAAAFIGKPAAKLVMGTFHSLAARLLRRHAEAAGVNRDFVVVDDEDSERLLRSAVEMLVPVDAEDRSQRITALVRAATTAVRRWKCWGLTAAEAESKERPRRKDDEERLAAIYVLYQYELDRRGMLDFGDLVLRAVGLLESRQDILMLEAARVRHLLVDEAQDANSVQVRFAKLLASAGASIFVVGDPDQSIFSFQGGYPEAMSELAGGGARAYPLVLNRRCTHEILAPAVAIVDWNRRAEPKVLRGERAGAPVEVFVHGSDREEAVAVSERIRGLVAGGARYDDIAVLVRSSFVSPLVEEALLRAAIPYELTGGASLLDREEVRDIAAYVRLAVNPYDDLAFARIHNRPTRGLGPVTEHLVVDLALKQGCEIFEVCVRAASDPGIRLPSKAAPGLARLGGQLDRLARAVSHQGAEVERLLTIILSPEGLGYEAYAARGDDRAARRRLDNLATLRRIALEEPSPIDFLERLALGGEIAEQRRTKGCVVISTMHSSKGLEWDHVLCPAFDGAVIPSPRAIREGDRGRAGDRWAGPSGGGVEEERRLAHVAFTRARRTLWISAPMGRSGRPTSPSAFLPESGLDLGDVFDPLADPMKRGGPKTKGRSRTFGRKGFDRR